MRRWEKEGEGRRRGGGGEKEGEGRADGGERGGEERGLKKAFSSNNGI